MKSRNEYNRVYVSKFFDLGYFEEGEFIDDRNTGLLEIN
jgi:hypothetical protein